MNQRIYKEYIKEIKTVFPVKGKQEREYIKKLSNDVADFCENENIESKKNYMTTTGHPLKWFHIIFLQKEYLMLSIKSELVNT